MEGSDQNGAQHRSARQGQTDAQPVWEVRLAARQAGWPRHRFNPLAPAGRIRSCNDSRTSRRCPPHEDHQFIALNVIDDSSSAHTNSELTATSPSAAVPSDQNP